MKKGSDTLSFTYDASGTPTTVTHNGTVYYYVTNFQGDVVKIVSATGTTVATYAYDAWGNPTGTIPTTGIAALNPLRYRGYVYDAETGLYYLQSRYYNPHTGRFLNADDIGCLGADGTICSYNLFTYSLNNPVILGDPDGFDAIVLLKTGAGGHIGLMIQDKEDNWWHFYWGSGGLRVAYNFVSYHISGKTNDTPLKVKFVPYPDSDGGKPTLREINKSGVYTNHPLFKRYSKMIYLEGDYTASWEMANDLVDLNGDDRYNFNGMNCSNVSFDILSKSNPAAKQAANKLMPRRAFSTFAIDYISQPLSKPELYFTRGGKYVK